MNNAQAIQSSPATAAGFDLEDLDNNSVNQVTYDVVLTEDLDGNPITTLKILGRNSAEYQAASEKIRIANIKRASKRSKQIDTSTDDGAKLVAATIEANELEQAIAVTVGWSGFKAGGQLVDFDAKYIPGLFAKFPTYLAKVHAALVNDANFTKG